MAGAFNCVGGATTQAGSGLFTFSALTAAFFALVAAVDARTATFTVFSPLP